jgi:hypothetical protein
MWRRCVVYLYVSMKLSNWNGRAECEMSGSEQTRKTLMEESQQEVQFISESRPCRTYLRGASSGWPLKYVQSYDCIIMPVETVFVNYCCIIRVWL